MFIKSKITQEKEIEIAIPACYKENNVDNFFAILDEKTAIDLYISKDGDYVSITHTTPEKRGTQINNVFGKGWTRVSEVDFLQAYDDALSAISLRPKLNESFVDSLNVLDLKRNVNKNDSPVPDRITVISEIPEIKP